ncbi:DUF4177 domain-containing protein [Cohnella caldifontis]|uniref:DUF4177 domain-containing protein n=1 Tax=Cohnella caldifontis TaxID=3027471 RepID=UPI0023ED1CF6|nr:DUF4177 domain-containing protein [Cohnella sp. YIM B05605]
MYEYIFVEASPGGFFSEATHRETILEFARKGWRLVQVLPADFNMEGRPRTYEIIFERPLTDTIEPSENA